MAGGVGATDRVQDGKRGPDGVGQIVPGQLGPLVSGTKGLKTTPDQTDGEDQNGTPTPLIEPTGEVTRGIDGDETDDPSGDVEQFGLLGGVAEVLDDLRREGAGGRVVDIHGRDDDDDQVGLRILPDLDELAHFEAFVFDPRLVLAHAFDAHNFFFAAEAWRRHGAVREEDDNADPDGDGDEPVDQEDDLP